VPLDYLVPSINLHHATITDGFNDNLPGFPRLPCKYTPCAASYLGDNVQPGTPVDPAKPMQGPYGTGMSGPSFGLCPGSRDWIKESDGPLTGHDWIRAPPEAPTHLDDTDAVMKELALKKLDAFAGIGHGYFFWNFRTDLYEPQWSYLEAVKRGWIPKGAAEQLGAATYMACDKEDKGDFNCVLKGGQLEKNIHNACAYIMNIENATEAQMWLVGNLSGSALENTANNMIGAAFRRYRHVGVTCDFGGIALLVEGNKTTIAATDRDKDYYTTIVSNNGNGKYNFNTVTIVLAILVVGLLGGTVGFGMALRFSPALRERVRSHASLMMPIADNPIVRSISGVNWELPQHLYEEVGDIMNEQEEKHVPISF
jgi:hypothetical protein